MGRRRIPLPDRKSLTFRLIVGASLLCGATLLAAYVLLTTLFDLHLRRGVDADLVDRLDDLAAGLETTADGGFGLAREPDLPKYDRQLSGQYWQVEAEDTPPIRSRSLWDARLPEAVAECALGEISLREIKGPALGAAAPGAAHAAVRGAAPPVTFSVAADLAPVQAAARQFSRILAIALVVLGVGLVSARRAAGARRLAAAGARSRPRWPRSAPAPSSGCRTMRRPRSRRWRTS